MVWTLDEGALPPGLSLAEDGAITGTLPRNSAGVYEFTVRATEATGLTAAQEKSIRVAPGCAPEPTAGPTEQPTGTGPTDEPGAVVPTAVAGGDPAPARDAMGTADDLEWLAVADRDGGCGTDRRRADTVTPQLPELSLVSAAWVQPPCSLVPACGWGHRLERVE